ncbi:MAG: nuclear transport factor 2 family protein [Planctomycetes bacterium]|nr:nuclear transport factor 2 family protein [Planctomycetota bacterium]
MKHFALLVRGRGTAPSPLQRPARRSRGERRASRPLPVLLLAPLLAAGCARTEITEDDRTEIYNVLERQQMAWNDGDVRDFMDGYLRSDDTVFAGAGEFHRGWQTVLSRYEKAYPAGRMGRLSFGDLEIDSAGPDAALVLGRWELQEADGAAGGVFTLLFRRADDGWRIVHDHTTSRPEPSR